MTQQKPFWLCINGGILLFYAYVVYLLLQGADFSQRQVIVALVILGAHVLEIPLAIKLLKEQKPSLGLLCFMTFLFGFTWWLPVRRGVYSTR